MGIGSLRTKICSGKIIGKNIFFQLFRFIRLFMAGAAGHDAGKCKDQKYFFHLVLQVKIP